LVICILKSLIVCISAMSCCKDRVLISVSKLHIETCVNLKSRTHNGAFWRCSKWRFGSWEWWESMESKGA